jgi:hypothetical protein
MYSLTKGIEPVEEYSKQLAWARAGANPECEDPRYWEVMAYYNDASSFNRDMQLNRQPELMYRETDLWWQWEDEVYKDEYRKLRREEDREREFRKSLRSVAVGIFAAEILNRIISTAHLAADIRNGKTDLGPALTTVRTTFDPFRKSYHLTAEVNFRLAR